MNAVYAMGKTIEERKGIRRKERNKKKEKTSERTKQSVEENGKAVKGGETSDCLVCE